MSGTRRRVTIIDVPLVIQPDEAHVATFSPPRRGEWVRPLPQTPEDRSEGRRRFEVVVDGWRFEATVEDAARAELREQAARVAAEHGVHAHASLRAQIPGRVVRLWVESGESVDAGQRLLAIEAMKMENEIRAPRAGVVDEVAVEVGSLVERNDLLLTLS